MQLDAASTAAKRALGLGQRVGGGIEAAEGEQASLGGSGRVDHRVVGAWVTVRLLHREDERPAPDVLESRNELVALAAVAVGIVGADVRVCIERLQVGNLHAQALKPVEDALVRDHARQTNAGPACLPAAA